jgi:hypothetical protein
VAKDIHRALEALGGGFDIFPYDTDMNSSASANYSRVLS